MQYCEKTIQLQELLGQSKEALEEVIKSFEGNATFKEGPDAKEYINFPIAKALLHAVASGQRYYLVGEAGIGKTSFAKWCYSTGPTCKEKSIYCSPEMNPTPYIDETNPYTLTDVKY